MCLEKLMVALHSIFYPDPPSISPPQVSTKSAFGNLALHISHLVVLIFFFIQEAVHKMLGSDGKDNVIICYLGNWQWMSPPFVVCMLWP